MASAGTADERIDRNLRAAHRVHLSLSTDISCVLYIHEVYVSSRTWQPHGAIMTSNAFSPVVRFMPTSPMRSSQGKFAFRIARLGFRSACSVADYIHRQCEDATWEFELAVMIVRMTLTRL